MVFRTRARASLVVALLAASHGLAAAPIQQRAVDDADTVPVAGNVPQRVAMALDAGPTNGNLPLERMTLVLRPRARASARLERFLAEQLDPTSPDYHRWLTPDEYGHEFGATDEDLNAVLDWLQRNGFAIDGVARGRGWVNFTGSVASVEGTFRTEIHDVVLGGRLHRANVRDPEVPRALADVVAGVVSLHDFFKTSQARIVPFATRGAPLTNLSDGSRALGPADFATIYDSAPLLSAGVDGTGQTVAVVSRSNIKVADVRYFRSFFGLPAKDPAITLNGVDPGLVKDDEGEADLDVEWAGAVAPGALVNLVVSKDTLASDGVDLSAQYIVDNDLAPVMTISYGLCEADLGTSGLQFYDALWKQAAAQGITVFVSTGDSGVAACDASNAAAGTGGAVNGLASTTHNVAVGGTQFDDGGSPSQYWSASDAPGSHLSATSYIPERAWNESGLVSGGSALWATGGGPSFAYAKPSWQSAPGVPNDGGRDIPDVSLNAASNVGYVTFQEYDPAAGSFYVSSGTSASAPAFAGIMALVVQSRGARQGNANPELYRLASAQLGGSGPAVFHDVTAGDNGVPGVAGFSCATGYDLATGLGSVDVQALVSSFGVAATADLSIAGGPSVSLAAGSSASVTVTTTGRNGFSSAVSLSAGRLPGGMSATFSPQSLPAPGSGAATLSLSAPAATVPGVYGLTVTASGGGLSRTAVLAVVVASVPAPLVSSFAASPASISSAQSATLSWATANGMASSIDNGVGAVPAVGSLTVSPAQTTTYTLTVTGPGGTSIASTTVTVSDGVLSVTRLVPIVVDVAGVSGARFSSELTLANRGTSTANVTLAYTAASTLSGAGSGTVTTSLEPGRQVVLPDAIAFLRTNGLAIPADGTSQGGTLLVTFTGLSATDVAFASVRTTTPSGSGRAGLSYASIRTDDLNGPNGLQTGTSWLYGLREDAADRTNLALVNAGGSSVTLSLTLFDASGAGAYRVAPDVSLGPGQWRQLDQVLSPADFSAGYARIDVVSGSGPYLAYAVFNDNVTNDGSFVPVQPGNPASEMLLLPVLVETSVFRSELVLANESAVPATAVLTYTESLTPALGGGGSVAVTLAAGEQRIIPNAIDSLRQLGVSVGAKGAASYAGSLSVQFLRSGDPSAGFAGARTAAPASGGGEYGVFYPAIGLSGTDTTDAWIFGLQETAMVRANLAVANVGNAGSDITFHVEVRDGDTGQLAGRSADTVLAPAGWVQIDDVLRRYGTSNGFVRVVRTSGTGRFVAYGVVNDGATPTSGATNDGSYLAFSNR